MKDEHQLAMQEDDEQPMISKHSSDSVVSFGNKEHAPGPNDYIEKRKFCCCFTIKCGIISLGVLLFIDFIIESLNTSEIGQNEYFDSVYFNIMLTLMAFYFIAVILFFIYIVAPDSKWSRELVPWSLLLAAITNILIAIWIFIYILAIYKRDKVYVTTGKNGNDDDQGWYHDEDGGTKMRYAK